jgi:hypothetical protein
VNGGDLSVKVRQRSAAAALIRLTGLSDVGIKPPTVESDGFEPLRDTDAAHRKSLVKDDRSIKTSQRGLEVACIPAGQSNPRLSEVQSIQSVRFRKFGIHVVEVFILLEPATEGALSGARNTRDHEMPNRLSR